MKVLKGLLILIIAVIAIYIVAALVGPSNYKITRTIEIAAPIDVIFDQTSIYANWANWSPWAKLDSNAKYTIKDDNQSVGSSMGWEGNDKVGIGTMTTSKIETNKEFSYDLSFVEPFEMTSHGGFTYEQKGDNVLLTWHDGADLAFMSRPFMLFMDMEEEIGPSFEKGLAEIKAICENMSTSSLDITEQVVESNSILYISENSSLLPNEIGAKMRAAYGELMSLAGLAKLEMTSAPISITHKFSMEEMLCEFDAAIVINDIPEELELSGRIQKGETYAGKVLRTVHIGAYAKLKTTYDAILAHIAKNGYEINGSSWEEYVDDPTKVAEKELKTFIYFPVK